MGKIKGTGKISFCAILVAIYFALTPIHQMLLLSGGSTINKYLSILIAAMIVVKKLWDTKQGSDYHTASLNTEITRIAVGIIVYVFISVAWAVSKQVAITSAVSITEYIIFTILVCTVEWNKKEKNLFLFAIVISCLFYSITITKDISVNRAVLSGFNGEQTDPNMLATNLAIGAIICLRLFLISVKNYIRWASLVCMITTLYGIVATGSRGGLIACIAGMVFVLFKSKPSGKQIARTLIVIVIVVIGFELIVSGKTSLSETIIERFVTQEQVEGGNGRTEIWGRYFRMLFGQGYSIIMGNGYGNAGKGHAAFYHTPWEPATHNDFIELLCGGGLILVVLVAWLVIKTWDISKKHNNVIGNAVLVVSLISGITLNCFERYLWWNCIILAYIGVDCLKNTEETNERKGIPHISDNW